MHLEVEKNKLIAILSVFERMQGGDVVFTADAKGLETRQVDGSHCVQVGIDLPPDSFHTFTLAHPPVRFPVGLEWALGVLEGPLFAGEERVLIDLDESREVTMSAVTFSAKTGAATPAKASASVRFKQSWEGYRWHPSDKMSDPLGPRFPSLSSFDRCVRFNAPPTLLSAAFDKLIKKDAEVPKLRSRRVGCGTDEKDPYDSLSLKFNATSEELRLSGYRRKKCLTDVNHAMSSFELLMFTRAAKSKYAMRHLAKLMPLCGVSERIQLTLGTEVPLEMLFHLVGGGVVRVMMSPLLPPLPFGK